MTTPVPPFTPGTCEGVCKILAGLYSGTELTRILAEVPLRNDLGEGETKWRRADSSERRNT